MGSNLHQVLRSLCLNTDWKYAIFWKLKHRARMILTWEDAYYDNPDDYDTSESKFCWKTLEQIDGGHFTRDPLGLAVAKMSYHVYSLGEGIVGQVAVSGNHQWICPHNQVAGSSSSFEFADGWQSQFSAGIRTIVVVAVVPLGVVQLGSLNKVIEDMQVVTHVRNLFLRTQYYSIGDIPTQIQNSVKISSSMLDVSVENFSSEIMPGCLHDAEEVMTSETLDSLMPFQCSGKNYSSRAVYQKVAVDMAEHERCEFNSDESSILIHSISNTRNVECQKSVELRPLNESECERHSNHHMGAEKKESSFLPNLVTDNNRFNDLICPSEKADSPIFPSDFLDAVVCESDMLHVDVDQKWVLPRPSDANSQKDTENSKVQFESCYKDTSYMFKFPAGCELHEALGPAFLKGSEYFDGAALVNQGVKILEMPDEMICSQLTSESCPEHLLEAKEANVCNTDVSNELAFCTSMQTVMTSDKSPEAMLANVCCNNTNVNNELSFCTSMQTALTSGKNPEASFHTAPAISSGGYSTGRPSLVRVDKRQCLSSSVISGVMSPGGFSSACLSSCSEQFERSSEPANKSKKRARPGESCRPRPRDRQLIQDRIKELRELVPNGAKCSIDSLLECTIKHMLFLQSITKHADKLNKFSDSKSKLRQMETDIFGSSSYEQGSSWAMEVGGHLKVRSILVENLSKNGQMVVEMLCEECSHFLEIAEAIRSLGLTILKGATEAQGEQTWICFVVEGQNNRNLHRLDVLCPLVQMLQSKSSMSS